MSIVIEADITSKGKTYKTFIKTARIGVSTSTMNINEAKAFESKAEAERFIESVPTLKGRHKIAEYAMAYHFNYCKSPVEVDLYYCEIVKRGKEHSVCKLFLSQSFNPTGQFRLASDTCTADIIYPKEF